MKNAPCKRVLQSWVTSLNAPPATTSPVLGKQKHNFEKHHRAKELVTLEQGQHSLDKR